MYIDIKRISFGKKYLKDFTGYENNNENITPLLNKLPKLNEDVKHF